MGRKFFAMVLALGLVLGACGDGGAEPGSDTTVSTSETPVTTMSETTTSTAEAAMDQLKVVILPYITYAPYYIAIEEGYFAEQGIEVEVVNMTVTEEVMPALSSGQVDVAGPLINAGVLNAIARGADVEIVADKGYIDPEAECVSFSLIGRSGLVEAGDLETADQMAGMNVGVVPATWLEYYLAKVLETGGIGLDDIVSHNTGSPSMVDALASEQLDVVVNSEPWLTIFKSHGHSEVFGPGQEVLPGESVAVQVYGPNLLNENRELGVRFMAAYLKAVEQYAEGATERNLDIIEGFTELDRGLLETMCWPAINPTGEVLVDGVLDFQQFAVDRGYLDEVVPAEDFYDGSFLEEARELMEESG